MPPLLSHSITDKGLLRDNNEDCFLSRPDLGLWLVADGMGGHEAGEVASALTRDTIEQLLSDGESLEHAILAAHQAVIEAIKSGEGAQGMGSTVIALQSLTTRYKVAWVGDSRAYLWTATPEGGELEQLSKDHSYVQMLLESGSIDIEEMEHHPEKNVITQCIGSFDNPEIHVDSYEGHWQENQWILLCSDGLTDEVNNQEIAEILCTADAPKVAAEQLIKTALNNGGKDNVSIQIIETPVTESAESKFKALHITNNRSLDLLFYSLMCLFALALAYWLL